jgi:hypothetical protein
VEVKVARRDRAAGRALRLKVKRAGLSYNQVAQLAGCSWSMVDKVCHGEKTSAPITQIINRLKPANGVTARRARKRRRTAA